MPTFIYTKPRVEVLEVSIPFSTFVALNTSYTILAAAVGLQSHWRIVDIVSFKETAFDNGAVIKIGHGAGATDRETICTGTEVDATNVNMGTVRHTAWMQGSLNLNTLLKTSDRAILARCETGLPTVGELRLKIMYISIPGAI